MSTWNNLDVVDLVVLCWLGAMPVGMLLILVWDCAKRRYNQWYLKKLEPKRPYWWQ